MIDTHCHIDFEEYDKDREEVIKRAKEKLDAVVISGIGLESNKKLLNYCKNDDFIYPSLGFHPIRSHEVPLTELEETCKHIIENKKDIVAIGEVGLDYYYVKDKTIRNIQMERFKTFVELSNDHKIPLLIHSRDAYKKALNLILEYEDIPYVIFHCYSGSYKTAKRIMEHDNYFMSFSAMLTYSKPHQELVEKIPIESMVTETDSPYLALTKEERNEPINVKYAIEKIAEIKNIDINTVDEVTTQNAKKAFQL